ncbi:MAG: dihydropteroate synthase [Bacteroidales bacterium]|nr:dihydropteroate synthase [Bacteroidales bacterium]
MERKIGSHICNTPLVMGIVNITPDSFYAPSRQATPKEVFKTIELMIEEGAGIVDVGAASSRPGADRLSTEEEWERLVPVLKELRRFFPHALFSLDTCHSSIVERAYGLIGPFIINDISSGEEDPLMFGLAARRQLPLIAMHKRGTPQTMQQHTDYTDVVAEVRGYFASVLKRAEEAGLSQIILDPGFGFAKTTEQNYRLLAELPAVFDFPHVLGLIGISRKSMIYKPLHITPQEALPATSALHLYALQQGADILRVHDVAAAIQVIKLHQLLSPSSTS